MGRWCLRLNPYGRGNYTNAAAARNAKRMLTTEYFTTSTSCVLSVDSRRERG